MTQTIKRFVFAFLTAMLLLSACTPANTPAPQPPQQLIDNTANDIGTAVALTVAAQNTETAAAQPTVTDTPIPTETISIPPTPILPTATPFVLVPPSSGSGGSSGGSGGGGSSPVPQLDCTVVSEKPFDGTEFKPGDNFNKVWVIKNTGKKTWLASYGWHFFSGTAMTTTADTTLGKAVKPGDTIELRVGVVAPAIDKKDTGKIFVTYWAIIGEGSKFCRPYVAIKVVYPGTNP